jgi:GNAT superfamily N-acetyltransferase
MQKAMAQKYRLIRCDYQGETVCLAGFRFLDTLSWGHILIVDDLVTAPERRSLGFGGLMIERLQLIAQRCRCSQIQLESDLRRERAHAFYQKHGFRVNCFRFVRDSWVSETRYGAF